MTEIGRAISLVALVFAFGCSPTVGNGFPSTETRAIGAVFERVRISDGLAVEITVDPDNAGAVTVTSDANLVPIIETELVGGVLEISADDIDPRVSTLIGVRMTTLASASAADAGSSIVVMPGIDRTGPGEMGTFAINLSEGAIADLSGACRELIAIVSGPSVLSARNLICENGELDVLDGAMVEVHVSERVNVRSTGASVTRVSGSPSDIQQSLSGDATLIVE